MRGVASASKRDPLNRLLAGTADALRARRQLPARDPRRASSRWLRPNWPDQLLLSASVHRTHLIEALTWDAALRQEVRDRLGIRALDDLAASGLGKRGAAEMSELLAAALAAADDPVGTIESAATDKDPVVAAAAVPYLTGDLPLPATDWRPSPQGGQRNARTAAQEERLRRRARDAEKTAKSLRQQLRDQQIESSDLQDLLQAATGRAEQAEERVTELESQLPSRRERAALASASAQEDKIRELNRVAARERTEHQARVRQLQGQLSEAETALAGTQQRLDAEARGRHKLEAEMGDARSRAARLIPLAEREAADLRQGAGGVPASPARTRQLKRAERLYELTASLWTAPAILEALSCRHD